MATEIWVNIGSGNGFLPDGTKPIPEPMLTDHQWSPVTFILRQFHKRCLNHQSLKSIWKLHIKISFKFHRPQWVNQGRSYDIRNLNNRKHYYPKHSQNYVTTSILAHPEIYGSVSRPHFCKNKQTNKQTKLKQSLTNQGRLKWLNPSYSYS